MNGSRQERPEGMIEDWKKGLNFAVFCLRVLSLPIDVCVRRPGSRGREFADPPTILISLLFLPMAFPLFVPVLYGMEWYLILWGLLLVWNGVHNVCGWMRKDHIHRHYIGDPLIGSGETRNGELFLGLMLFGIGFCFSNTLGMLLLVSTLASRINLVHIRAREKRQIELMKDSRIEAQHFSEQMRQQP